MREKSSFGGGGALLSGSAVSGMSGGGGVTGSAGRAGSGRLRAVAAASGDGPKFGGGAEATRDKVAVNRERISQMRDLVELLEQRLASVATFNGGGGGSGGGSLGSARGGQLLLPRIDVGPHDDGA